MEYPDVHLSDDLDIQTTLTLR